MGRIKKKYGKKSRKSFFKNKFLLIFVLVFFFTLFLLYQFLFDSFYQLDKITVEGTNLTPRASLSELVKREVATELFIESNSIIPVSIKRLEKEILSNYPHIEKVEINKNFPNQLLIRVFEREKKANWCFSSEGEPFSCVAVDSQGIVFKGENFNEDEFFIHQPEAIEAQFGKRILSENKVNFIFESKNKLRNDFNYEMRSAHIPTSRYLFVNTDQEFELRFDMESDLSSQLDKLEILIEEKIDHPEEIEYIELRYGSRIYYK